jgi:hypothetical protein
MMQIRRVKTLPVMVALGLLIVLAGVPAYFLWKRRD